MSKRDYYEVLGIAKTASDDEIKKAYRKLAMEYHPDRNPGNQESEKKFKEVTEAYEVLKDSQKRSAYDRFGHNAFQNSGGGGGFRGNNQDFNDIFGDFFNEFMGGSRGRHHNNSGKIRGSDLKYNISITLEEAFNGVEKKINFATMVGCSSCNGSGSQDGGSVENCGHCHGHGTIRMQQGFFMLEQTCHACGGQGKIIKNPCKKCNGEGRYNDTKTLQVNIPAGVENGTRIRLAGEGEAGIKGGNNGDLYIFVSVNTHPLFRTESNGADLHCRLPISVTTAILGGEIEVPTIDGGAINLKIPAGTQTGDKFRVKDKGMTKIRSSARGDMYVHTFVEIPKSLTKKQKEIVETLQKELGETNLSNSEDKKSFFDKMKNLWGKE